MDFIKALLELAYTLGFDYPNPDGVNGPTLGQHSVAELASLKKELIAFIKTELNAYP